jgi:hypothetical protein
MSLNQPPTAELRSELSGKRLTPLLPLAASEVRRAKMKLFLGAGGNVTEPNRLRPQLVAARAAGERSQAAPKA